MAGQSKCLEVSVICKTPECFQRRFPWLPFLPVVEMDSKLHVDEVHKIDVSASLDGTEKL